MIGSTQHARGRLRGRAAFGGFGIVSTEVNGAMVYGNPVSRISSPARGVPARPIVNPDQPGWPASAQRPTGWGGNPPQAGGGSYYQSGYGSGSQNNLAQLLLLYQSNPSSLTSAQWQQLQAAGAIPGTVPYSNASLVNPSTSSNAIDPTTGIPYATELAETQAGLTTTTAAASTSSIMGVDPTTGATTIFGIDWYYLAAAAALAYVMTGKRR